MMGQLFEIKELLTQLKPFIAREDEHQFSRQVPKSDVADIDYNIAVSSYGK